MKSYNSLTYRAAPRRRIVLKIVLLFLLLIGSVIATAAYSTFLENRRANYFFSQELLRKVGIASSIQNGEKEKLEIISGIVKEQNQRYCDFLDYDNLSALTFMLKSIATIHGIDLAFVFDENGDLATTYPKGPHVKNPSIYGNLISDRRARTDVEHISAAMLIDQIPDFVSRSNDQVLCFKSLIPLLHDTGEIYGYVVLVKLINGNKKLAERMADLSRADIVYYDLCGKVILTSFTASRIPYPKKGIIAFKGESFRTWGANVTDANGQVFGRLIVAVDNKPFLEKRRYLLLRNLIPFFTTVIICLALLFLLKTRVFDKIRQLITALRGVSEGEGDLSIRLQIPPERVTNKNLDEVEQMGIDFNHMMDKLEEAYNQLAEARKEAETASISKSQFLANMSHEIRTPMNAVIGFSDMLIDTDLDETQTDYAKTIKRSGDALLSLINDILDFSKIEAGELQFEDVDFDPELVTYDVCDLIRPKIGSKPIEVLCRVGDNVPSLVRGDPTRFRQVLTNLMGNAPKFTESGEIELSLYVEEERDEEVKLHAAIRDTGIGIDRDKLSHIFDQFQQADGSTTRKYGGTGLGLSICKKIANLMNGDVWAESP
ncbi:MAG: ATP-binding protein, partial [Thermodesulfobacteriota bacterium]|nr:ATP-binding protein [Thermodesulfobacteriota bacterium]